ncbi:MAG TPA: hypothetical protein VGI80_07650 [Pyrinomonadaceae bacterium]
MTTASFAQKRTTTAESIAAAGSFNGQEYSNSVLGFSMLAPGGWSFYNADQNQAAVMRNKQTASQMRDANLESSAANTQVLFQAIPPKFANQDKQAILSAGIEKLSGQTTIDKYAADQKALVLGASNVRITKDIYAVTYGGTTFAGFDIEGKRNEGPYRQRYLMTVRHNVAIFIVATFFDDRQSAIVDASLRSIKFK